MNEMKTFDKMKVSEFPPKKQEPILVEFDSSDAVCRFVDVVFNMEDGKGITVKIGGKDWEAEAKRLREIFERLDRLHTPHTPDNRFGMMDSPYSLAKHTRDAINEALKKN